MERYRLTKMPNQETLEGLINCPPSSIFHIDTGVIERTRQKTPKGRLTYKIKEIPDQRTLEAFINGEALFNVDTGEFELKG